MAAHFGYHFLDTGSLYRMVGLAVLRERRRPAATATRRSPRRSRSIPRAFRDEDLRGEDVGGAASIVAVIPEVRAALLDFQRDFASESPGAVLDGRDIGTVVCPDAEAKLFITATPEVRARRRQQELAARGDGVPYQAVLAEIRARDERDRARPPPRWCRRPMPWSSTHRTWVTAGAGRGHRRGHAKTA